VSKITKIGWQQTNFWNNKTGALLWLAYSVAYRADVIALYRPI